MLADRPNRREETNVQPSLECQYQLRKDDLVWRGVDDETIILDLRTSLYLALNSAAASLWLSLEEGATERQMTESLRAEYGIDEERATSDVKAFLACCQERDLLDPTV